ncbi:unnamed protein product [Rotaria sordida]|uniref:Small ribosomal subunit protein uS10m n=1 Tax=Rotaria sordida TaxID=392033 RepID=A0A818Q8E2_9BILA|nr:unnamed protein product [Rotaria sordida]CAF3633042.1 unnamed protein product [Rotaria sordida]
MLARTVFNQIFLFKPSQIPISALSLNYRSITTAARLKKQLKIPSTPRPHIERPVGSDELYKRLCVEVRGHDPAVLESYERFVRLVSTELDIQLVNVENPLFFTERWTLLRSKFAKKKYWREYEIRTYYKKFHFKHLTGSTADTFLEYVQRNLPEGIMMIVERIRLEPFRDNLVSPSSSSSSTTTSDNNSEQQENS